MPKNESEYKRAGSLWFREKREEDGTHRKYLAEQIELEIDGKTITANVTIFANRAKIHAKQPDSFLYVSVAEESDTEDELLEIPFNENNDIIF